MTSEQLALIEGLINQESYNQAIVILEKLIEANPENLNYYWYLGLIYLLQENEELAQGTWLSVLFQGSERQYNRLIVELIDFLEMKTESYIRTKRLGNAKIICQTIIDFFPEYSNGLLKEKLVNEIILYGSHLSFEKDHENATFVYQNALDLDNENIQALHGLSLGYYHQGEYNLAKENLENLVFLSSSNEEILNLLGSTYERLNLLDQSAAVFKKSISINVKSRFAYEKLINIYVLQKKYTEAIEVNIQALSIFPTDVSLWLSLSENYSQIGDSLNSNLAAGSYYQYKQDYQRAIEYYREYYRQTNARNIDFYIKLASCYNKLSLSDEAISILADGISNFPDCLTLKRLNQVIMPVVYETSEEVNFYRQRFTEQLDELINQTEISTEEQKSDFVRFMGNISNFHLSYQGFNDIDLKKKYSEYVHEVAKKISPQLTQYLAISEPYPGRKLRIGYISAQIGTLGLLYFNWVKLINKDRFASFVYDLSGENKEKFRFYQNQFLQYADCYRVIAEKPDIKEVAAMIASDKIDVLIIPEISLNPLSEFLCCLRLAPIQCTTWAHPVTSGSPTIDCFLSSDLMEPYDGQEHYSEKLIRLPNLGFSFPPLEIPELTKSRSDFGLEEDKIIYFCSQSLFKYLPRHDYLFPMIAKGNKNAKFVFLYSYHGEVVAKKFEQRLKKCFETFGLDYKEHFIIFPRFTKEEYLMLNQLSDIFLDCLSWSGGLTTRDAISCDLPVVTCPGEFMRGRHSYAILKMMGIEETIASNEQNYINIAVRLGLDNEWRRQIKNKIIANKHKIFNDQECVRGLENFLTETASKYYRP